MLVLSRGREQSIVINGDVVVTILEIRPDSVRLGIAADPSIPVHRLEVESAIRRERGEPTDDLERGLPWYDRPATGEGGRP